MTVADPLDEEPYDPLDEKALVPDDDMIRGGPVGFEIAVAKTSDRAARLAARPLSKGQDLSYLKRRAFLMALAKTGIVSMASAAAGWSNSTAYHFYKIDKTFAEQWDACIQISNDLINSEIHRRAMHGVERDVWNRKDGTVMGQETIYSDPLLIFLAKARQPEVYRERHDVRHEGSAVGGVLLLPADVPLDEWEAAAAAQQAQYRTKETDT